MSRERSVCVMFDSGLLGPSDDLSRNPALVLVTGGGSGIGKMIAAGFSQHGAKVYIAARKEGQLKEVSSLDHTGCCTNPLRDCQAANDLNKSATHKVQYITADISVCEISRRLRCICVLLIRPFGKSRAGCDALVAEFRKRENKLHVLVNNSGLVFFGAFDDFPEDEGWDNVFNVNVKSIFYCKCSEVTATISVTAWLIFH